MAQRTHSPRSERSKTKTENKKRSRNNFLESPVWSLISGKSVERKIPKFFEARLEFSYFDMLKNGARDSNRLGVKNSFLTQVVRVPK